MPEIVTQCPLCGSDHSRIFDKRQVHGQPVANRLCLACGLTYQSPRMTEAEAAAFYEAEYRQLYQGGEGPNAKDLAVQRARAEALAGFARTQIRPIARHLDIGCSAGLLLQKFQQDYGCQPVGVEPGNAYRAHARKQGLAVYASLDELRRKDEACFDLISMAHVLEHLPDPVGYLRSLRENLLAENGWLLIEVPNLYAHDSFEIAHLVSYSAHTLSQTLRKAGYEIVKLERHGRPRSDIIPYYLTILARPHPATFNLKPETGVMFKRKLGLLRRRILARLFPRRAWIPLS